MTSFSGFLWYANILSYIHTSVEPNCGLIPTPSFANFNNFQISAFIWLSYDFSFSKIIHIGKLIHPFVNLKSCHGFTVKQEVSCCTSGLTGSQLMVFRLQKSRYLYYMLLPLKHCNNLSKSFDDCLSYFFWFLHRQLSPDQWDIEHWES